MVTGKMALVEIEPVGADRESHLLAFTMEAV
jgi:hypothetical protein